MSSTYSCLLYHVVFATKNRQPLIREPWRERVHEYLGGAVRGLGGTPQGIGGVADHVHLFVGLKPTHCLADFVREIKKSSSAWIADTAQEPGFRWQEGYAVFSVSASLRPTVREYIAHQEEHHRTKTFREELIGFLKKSGIDYDGRFLD
jgi:putative transposase